MALRDTSWITDTHAIGVDYEKSWEKIWSANGASYYKTVVRSVDEWICLTESAAKAYVDAHASDTNETHRALETNRVIGAWKLTRSVDSDSGWTKI